MKKILSLILALTFALTLIGCGAAESDADVKGEGVMTYAEYAAAVLDTEVVIEAYVQAKQSWWDNKGTFYLQDKEGGYFVYEMGCTEEEYNKLTQGTKIKVTGYKATFNGEIEVDAGATFEIMEGTWIAEPTDVTELLGTDDLINHQNKLSIFKGLTVKSLEYKQDEYDKDIYVTFTKGDAEYSFCVENYLTGPDTDVYQAVAALSEGDVVDVTAFLYWWNGPNPHITAVTAAN